MQNINIEDVEFVDAVTLVATPSHRRQLRLAQAEGRLHPDLALLMGVETGRCACHTCGMRHWKPEDARECCASLIDGPKATPSNYDFTIRRKRVKIAIIDGIGLSEAIKARLGVHVNVDAEEKLGLHQGYLSKIACRKRIGLTEETYRILRHLFDGEVPFVGVK